MDFGKGYGLCRHALLLGSSGLLTGNLLDFVSVPLAELQVDLLLIRIQRRVNHLQLQSLLYIGSVAEPENNFITEADALINLSGLLIEESQL